MLSESKVLYIDGIFLSYPKLFYHLFIIHEAKNITYTLKVFFFFFNGW